MRQVEVTYYLIRLAEEQGQLRFSPGDVLVYRRISRFPWIDLIFDLEPGTRCEVISADYDPLGEEPDFEPWDNHYYYSLRGLEEHGGIVTTEIVAMFDLEDFPQAFDSAVQWVSRSVEDYRKWYRKQRQATNIN